MKNEIKVLHMLKYPSAFLPVAMSLIALAVVLVHTAASGIGHETDEGAAAHVWQLLMAGQVPIVAFFLFRWFSQSPRTVLLMLGVQLGTALAAIAPVYFLHL